MTSDLLHSADPAATFTEPGTSATADAMLQHILATPRPTEPVRSGRRVIIAGALAGAAAAAVIAVSTLGLRPDASSAYAVEQQSDGDIVVTIHDMSDSEGLVRALAEDGVTTEVTYDPEQLKSELQNADQTPPIWVGVPYSPENPSGIPTDLPTPIIPTQQGDCPLFGVDVTPADDGGITFTLAASYIGPDTVLHLDISGSTDSVLVKVTWEDSAC